MKPERSIKELLIILRDNLENYFTYSYSDGMCVAIKELREDHRILDNEMKMLYDYLNKIKKYEGYTYWFPPKEVAPRLKWLNQQIEKL
jgi:hypothetical protein